MFVCSSALGCLCHCIVLTRMIFHLSGFLPLYCQVVVRRLSGRGLRRYSVGLVFAIGMFIWEMSGTTSGGPGSSCCARVNPFLSLSRSSPPPVRGFSRSRPVPASLAGFPDDDEDYDAAPNILRLEASSSSPPYWIARAERMEKTW